MAGTVKNIWLKNLLVGMAGRPMLKEFEKASRNVKETQDILIRRIVRSCQDTLFGSSRDGGKISI